jgi:hypothetical protein
VSIWTEADITALKAAVAGGVLTVSYDGPPKRLITYQSLTAMRALLAEMIADVTAAAGERRRFRYAKTSKGF